jgi:acetyl esterase/lipase
MPEPISFPSIHLRNAVFGNSFLKYVFLAAGSLVLSSLPTFGSDDSGPANAQTQAATQRVPTGADVAYGTHKRQTLDFYQAKSEKPTPLVFHVHGGGWVWGDKKKVPGLEKYLAAA